MSLQTQNLPETDAQSHATASEAESAAPDCYNREAFEAHAKQDNLNVARVGGANPGVYVSMATWRAWCYWCHAVDLMKSQAPAPLHYQRG
jgi:hypothetical protein